MRRNSMTLKSLYVCDGLEQCSYRTSNLIKKVQNSICGYPLNFLGLFKRLYRYDKSDKIERVRCYFQCMVS